MCTQLCTLHTGSYAPEYTYFIIKMTLLLHLYILYKNSTTTIYYVKGKLQYGLRILPYLMHIDKQTKSCSLKHT